MGIVYVSAGIVAFRNTNQGGVPFFL